MPTDPNLFDGRLAVFIGHPGSIQEISLAQLAGNLRSAAPNVRAVIVKTNTGLGWEGRGAADRPNLAIRAASDVRRWTETLGEHGLECHAWCAVSGAVAGRELDRIAEICLEGGVKSMLLGLERDPSGARPPCRTAYAGDETAARRLAVGLRERVGPDFHLGLLFDARGDSPQSLFVQSAWFPEVDSLHPLVYHAQFGQTAAQALRDCWATLSHWGKPFYPVLQAFDLPAAEVAAAITVAHEHFQAPGLSLFRYGTGGGNGLNCDELAQAAARWPALAAGQWPVQKPAARTVPALAAVPGVMVVDPDDERSGLFTVGYYGDADALSRGWTRDHDAAGRARWYRAASRNEQMLYVSYTPRLSARGRYAVDAFIPRGHADARDVHYFVVDHPAGKRRETLAVLDQSPHSEAWVPLKGNTVSGPGAGDAVGEFNLDPALPESGRVNVADVTFEDPAGRPRQRFEISFGALRWRPLDAPVDAGGFDSPVGSAAERAGPFAEGGRLGGAYSLWCGNWYDANPRGTRYWLGNRWAVHTGADLNLEGPGGVLADRDAPVYAAADGRVISAGFVSSGWKNVIVMEHPLPADGRVIYARYAHVTDMRVRPNDLVRRGQQLAAIGQYAPNNYHLHFDLTYSPILKTVPGHWPGDNLDLVLRTYLDPMVFIKERHVVR